MSGEPKTLTLTTRHGYAPVTYEMDKDNAIHRITFHLPPGAAWAGPDGAPVVARDEAAELRAALADLAGSYVTNKVPHDNLWNMLVRTEVLARARAALAASEGQP